MCSAWDTIAAGDLLWQTENNISEISGGPDGAEGGGAPAQSPEEPGDGSTPPAILGGGNGDGAQTSDPAGGESGTTIPTDTPGNEGGSAFPPGGWFGIGLAVGLLIAAAVAAAVGFRRKKSGQEQDRPGDGPALPKVPAIEKVHEQGARKSQQDCFSVSREESIQTHGLLAVVADGMGGLSNGDKVSQAAVTAAMNGFYLEKGAPGEVLLSLLSQANKAVNELLGPDGYYTGGSTFVAGLIRGGAFHYISVGDSRICLYRDGVLYQLNREHVYRNELYVEAVNGQDSVGSAGKHAKGSGLTSFLGMGTLKYVDIPARPVIIRPGDMFLLMSDGVYNALPEPELARALSVGEGAAEVIRAAIRAKAYTNQDNYTVVILRC